MNVGTLVFLTKTKVLVNVIENGVSGHAVEFGMVFSISARKRSCGSGFMHWFLGGKQAFLDFGEDECFECGFGEGKSGAEGEAGEAFAFARSANFAHHRATEKSGSEQSGESRGAEPKGAVVAEVFLEAGGHIDAMAQRLVMAAKRLARLLGTLHQIVYFGVLRLCIHSRSFSNSALVTGKSGADFCLSLLRKMNATIAWSTPKARAASHQEIWVKW